MTYRENPMLWYWGYGEQIETLFGGYERKEEAVDNALGSMMEPGELFTVARANKTLVQFDNLFVAQEIFEHIDERNEKCFGEDGPDYNVSEEAIKDLERSVDIALINWATRNKVNFNEYVFEKVTDVEVMSAPKKEVK